MIHEKDYKNSAQFMLNWLSYKQGHSLSDISIFWRKTNEGAWKQLELCSDL